MSQEIINVLNYLGEQLGIAIDWTSENVWPQILDILTRYRLLELVSGGLWLLAEVAMIILGLVVATKCIKANAKIRSTNQDNFWWYKGYSTVWLSGAGTALVVVAAVFGIISLISLPMEIGEMLEWFIVPEIKYLEMLKGLVA